MKRLARERTRQLLESGKHHFLDPVFQARMKPVKLAALHRSTLERRAAGTLGTQQLRPWQQHTASDHTCAAWAQAPSIIGMVDAGTSLAGVVRALGLQCSLKPVQNIMRKARTGWDPEQDVEWHEWARAYRALTPTGDQPHGTDPSGP